MEADAYSLYFKEVESLKQKNAFHCGICNSSLKSDCIRCDSCMLWYEFKYVNLKKPPKGDWFCFSCIKMFKKHSDKYI